METKFNAYTINAEPGSNALFKSSDHPRIRNVFIFPNSMIAVTDANGQQIPEMQGALFDMLTDHAALTEKCERYRRALDKAETILRNEENKCSCGPSAEDWCARCSASITARGILSEALAAAERKEGE